MKLSATYLEVTKSAITLQNLYCSLGTGNVKIWLIINVPHKLMANCTPLVTKLIFRKNLLFIKLQIIEYMSTKRCTDKYIITHDQKTSDTREIQVSFKKISDDWKIYFSGVQTNYHFSCFLIIYFKCCSLFILINTNV